METLPERRGRKKGSTAIATTMRRQDVMSMLLKAEPRDIIVAYVMEKYEVSEPTAVLDLCKCYEQLREQYADRLQDMVAINHARLERLFNQWDTIDGNLQLKIIDTQNKMAGIYRPDTAVQVNNVNLNLDDLTVDELKKMLNE